MNARHLVRPVVVPLTALLLSGDGLGQSVQEPYKPSIYQPGKDVAWVPSPQALVDRMLEIALVTPQDFVIDLGSGDGVMVISAAKRGARALGIEYNPELVELSRARAAAEGVSERTSFIKADIFESDFSQATVITMFLLQSLNMKLRPIILDLKPGTRIVSNTFDMGDWAPDDRVPRPEMCDTWCTAYLWIVPAKVEGVWQLGPRELTLRQEFQAFSGTLGSSFISGKLRGSEIAFTVDGVVYSGQVDGRVMRGSVGGRGETWTATKK